MSKLSQLLVLKEVKLRPNIEDQIVQFVLQTVNTLLKSDIGRVGVELHLEFLDTQGLQGSAIFRRAEFGI